MADQDIIRFGLRPTLIIGLGGTGHEVLVRLKARYLDAYGEDVFRIIKLLAFDTADEAKNTITEDGTPVQLDRGPELIHIGNVPTQRILKQIDLHPTIKAWLPTNMPSRSITAGAQQVRPMGRLALFTHFPKIKQFLEQAIRALSNIRQRGEIGEGGEIVRSQGINIFIITSVCGGTGSGIFIDMAYVLRQLCMNQGLDENYCHINGVLVLPQAFATVSGDAIRANAHAAFLELDYFTKEGNFAVEYPGGMDAESQIRPFNICYLVDGINERGKMLAGLNELAPMIAEAVFLQTASQVGESQKSTFDNVKALDGLDQDYPTAYSGFGTASLVFPTQVLIDACASRYCDNLVRVHLLHRKPDQAKLVGEEIDAVMEKMRLSRDGLKVEMSKDEKGRTMRIQLDAKSLDGIPDQNLVAQAVKLVQNQEDRQLNQRYQQYMEDNLTRLRTQMSETLHEEISRIVDDPELGLGLTIAFLRQLDKRLNEIVENFTKQKQSMDNEANKLERRSDAMRDALGEAISSFRIGRSGRVSKAKEAFIAHHKTRLDALFGRNLRSLTLTLLAYLSDDVVRVRLQELENLKDKLEVAQDRLSRLADELSDGRSRSLSPLTYEITDGSDVDKYYDKFVRELIQELPRLFEENGALHYWQSRSYEDVHNTLLDFGRSVFAGIRDVDLEQDVIMEKRDQVTPDVRLEELREDSVPFWNRDVTRMSDGGTFLETITVIGVQNKNDTIYSEVREGEMLASTHNRHAATVLTTRHGLTIYALQQFDDYKKRYERYRERQISPLHCFDIGNIRWMKMMFAVGQAFDCVQEEGNRYFIDFPAEFETLKETVDLGHGLSNSIETFLSVVEYSKQVEKLIEQYVKDESAKMVEKKLDAYIEAEYSKSTSLKEIERELKDLALEYKTEHLGYAKAPRFEAEELSEAEARIEAEARAKAIEIAQKMLVQGLDAAQIADMTGLSTDEVIALSEESVETAVEAKSREIARKMLAQGLDAAQVVTITGLSIEEIKTLSTEL